MLIDSNILIYAINSSSPKNIAAQKYLEENIDELIVAHQNIFETLRVITHPKFPSPMSPVQALNAVNEIIRVCRIISPDYKTHNIALEMIKKYNLSSDKVFDAYLTATAISNNVNSIATDNVKDFKNFEIDIVNPFSK
jgi:predicted nucleic acid-binding protein